MRESVRKPVKKKQWPRGADMWIKDQYVDIFCRWVYLPLYAILAAISLNEST